MFTYIFHKTFFFLVSSRMTHLFDVAPVVAAAHSPFLELL